MIERLLDAHETVITKVRRAIGLTNDNGDWGSNDLLMSDVLRRHELQVWFVGEHIVEVPLTDGARG
jgi:starvation-inducible DNA-binding protein